MLRAIVLATLALVACDRGKAGQPGIGSAPVGQDAVVTTRAAWFTEVDAFVTRGSSRGTAWRAQLTRLVDSDAWRTLPRNAFAQHGSELVRFFPAYKQLMLAVSSRGTPGDVLEVGLLGLDAYDAILRAADEFLADIPHDDPKRSVRAGGIEKMRLGAAIEVAGMLYVTLDAPDATRAAVLSRLSSDNTYAAFSRDGLQLLLATLDERLLPRLDGGKRMEYAPIRDAIARVHASKPDVRPSIRATYEGVGPTIGSTPLSRVVSSTGGFSVDTSPAALVKRVEVGPVGDPAEVHHEIELQDGAMRFHASCLDGFPAEALIKQLVSRGAVVNERPDPGTWLSIDRDGQSARMRLLAIGGRPCLVLAEGPAAAFPAARVDAFLASLRPAP